MLRASLQALGCVLALASCSIAGSAAAQQYPSHSVRMVVAAPPGGLTDIVARSVSQFLQEKLGQPFVVENIAGASSTIGAVQVARSAPDGYTLLVNPSLFVITPMLMSVQYDVVKDFTPISNFGTVPIAVGINPAIPAKTLQEFIALAKANPDKFTWGAEGVGAVGHLTMERIQRDADFKILIVHYKGTSPALLDLIAGRVSAMVSPVPESHRAVPRRHGAAGRSRHQAAGRARCLTFRRSKNPASRISRSAHGTACGDRRTCRRMLWPSSIVRSPKPSKRRG